MNKMPYEIKQKIRQYNKAILKAKALEKELVNMIEEYDVPIENFEALADIYGDEPQTEALACINNGECTTEKALESSIREIEEVFLWFVNRNDNKL